MNNKSTTRSRFTINWQTFIAALLGASLLVFGGGCQSAKTSEMQAIAAARAAAHSELVLKEGDSVKISFPGAPNLDATATVRRDGKITLPLGGEMEVVGKTPTQLEQDLADHYKDKLVSKEVVVSIQSSSFPIFVTGAVMKPGKVQSDHPMTVLEAVMESGGFDFSKANLKKVKIIREKPSAYYTLDFKGFQNGRPIESFYLKPYDIVYVPERFQWF